MRRTCSGKLSNDEGPMRSPGCSSAPPVGLAKFASRQQGRWIDGTEIRSDQIRSGHVCGSELSTRTTCQSSAAHAALGIYRTASGSHGHWTAYIQLASL